MALLAEAKRKVKYGLDPRNTNWSKDDSKFGQKLMEKMGWEKGKGLGANESGMVEHIKASYKSDTRGLGCSLKDADAWVAHQDDFNDLLKALNSEHGTDDAKDEEKSSKAQTDGQKRYYGRFARGRVATLRSTEDLDCIFGKRKASSEPTTPASQSPDGSDDESKTEHKHGLTTVTSSSSVQEYFAQKMAEMKARRSNGSGSGDAGSNEGENEQRKTGSEHSVNDRVPPIYGAVGFSYESEYVQSGNEDKTENIAGIRGVTFSIGPDVGDEAESLSAKEKKKSKKSKRKDKSEEGDGKEDESDGNNNKAEEGRKRKHEEDEEVTSTEVTTERKKSKKKKKRKTEEEVEELEDSVKGKEEEESDSGGKRRKSKKSKQSEEVEEENKEKIEDESSPDKGKKKKKSRNEEDSGGGGESLGKGDEDAGKKRKKRDKVKNDSEMEEKGVEEFVESESTDGSGKKSKKRSKRKRDDEESEGMVEATEIMPESSEAEKTKKKMKKSKKSSSDRSGDENNSVEEAVDGVSADGDDDGNSRTKKKSKKKQKEESCGQDESTNEVKESVKMSETKPKKRVTFSLPDDEESFVDAAADSVCEEKEKSKKKKNKKRKFEAEDEINSNNEIGQSVKSELPNHSQNDDELLSEMKPTKDEKVSSPGRKNKRKRANKKKGKKKETPPLAEIGKAFKGSNLSSIQGYAVGVTNQ